MCYLFAFLAGRGLANMTIQGFMESGPLVWDFIYHCIRETHDRENRSES